MSGKVTCEYGECTWTGPVEPVECDGKVIRCCDQCAVVLRAYVQHLAHEAVTSYTGGDVLDAAGNNLSANLRAAQTRWQLIQKAANDQRRVLRTCEEAALTDDAPEVTARLEIAAVTHAALQTRAEELQRQWQDIEGQIADALGVED